MKKKYQVNCYLGAPVVTDRNGRYVARRDPNGHVKLNRWRTGRHTRGRFKRPGQVFLTENHLRVAVVRYRRIKYSRRHRYVPLKRFTTAYVSPELLKMLTKKGLNS